MAALPCMAAGVRRRQGGFTMVELIAVLLLTGILAVVALPRLDGALAMRGAGWNDQVRAALQHGRSLAQGHRRLVCATPITGEVRLAIASAHPASSCDTPLAGPDGDARWAVDSNGLSMTVSPAGTLYFQPDGRITSDGAGSSTVNVSISVTGERVINLVGETGHVQ